MPLRAARVGRVGVIGHPVAKTADRHPGLSLQLHQALHRARPYLGHFLNDQDRVLRRTPLTTVDRAEQRIQGNPFIKSLNQGPKRRFATDAFIETLACLHGIHSPVPGSA